METIFMNTENNKMNEAHKFVANLSQRLYLKTLNRHVALQNLSIYHTWKNIRKQCKNNKLKVIVPTWNDELELPDGFYFVSDIQDCIDVSLKNMKHQQQFLLFMFTSIELIKG